MDLFLTLLLTKIVVTIIFLGYASYCDLRTREVPNRVWAYFAPCAAGLTVCDVILGAPILDVIVGVGFTVFFAFGFFHFKVFGGADAKALMCIGLTFPLLPGTHVLGFSLVVVGVAAALLIPYSMYGMTQKIRKREYSRESPFIPVLLASFITCMMIWLPLILNLT